MLFIKQLKLTNKFQWLETTILKVIKKCCSCCEVCTKGLGESCGGQFQYYGQCEKGLFCHQEEWSKSGTCLGKFSYAFNLGFMILTV